MQAHGIVSALHVVGILIGHTFCGVGHEIAAIAAEAIVHLGNCIAITARVVGCIVEALLRTGRVAGEVILDCSSVGSEGRYCEEEDEELRPPLGSVMHLGCEAGWGPAVAGDVHLVGSKVRRSGVEWRVVEAY